MEIRGHHATRLDAAPITGVTGACGATRESRLVANYFSVTVRNVLHVC